MFKLSLRELRSEAKQSPSLIPRSNLNAHTVIARSLWRSLRRQGSNLNARAVILSLSVILNPSVILSKAKDLLKANLTQRSFVSATAPNQGFLKLFALFTLAAIVVWIIPESTFAADTFEATRTTWIQSAQTGMTVVMLVLSKLLWLALIVIGPLLDNSILFSSCVDTAVPCKTMEDSLLSVWVQIRNIVNIVFVVILVFTALYNVIGRTEGEFVLKNMLPKILLGLIAVNFSFLASKVVLDAANVVTTAVAAIPVQSLQLQPDGEKFKELKGDMARDMCNSYKETKPGEYETVKLDASQISQWGLTGICQPETGKFVDAFDTDFLNGFTHTNLAFIITAEIANLSQFKIVTTKLTSGTASNFEAILDLLLEIIINFIIMALYGVSILALLAVAVARIVVLWLMIALSPLVVLFLIIPQFSQGLGDTDIKSTFIQHAIAPIIIVGSLSIGYILLASMTNDFELKDLELNAVANNVVKGQWESMHLGDLLALIGAVWVIWTGVFGAASKTKANFITEKLSGWTQAGAKFLAKLPLYATPIPVTPAGKGEHGGKLSLGQGMQYLENLPGALEDQLTSRTASEKAWKDAGLPIFGDEKSSAIRAVKDAKNLSEVERTLTGVVGIDLEGPQWSDLEKGIRKTAEKDNTNKDKLIQIADAIKAGNGDEDTIITNIRKVDVALASSLETAQGKAVAKKEEAKTQTTGAAAQPQPLPAATTASQLVAAGKTKNLSQEAQLSQPMKDLATAIEALGDKKTAVLGAIERQATTLGATDNDSFFAAAVEVATGKNKTGSKATAYMDSIKSDATKTGKAGAAFDNIIAVATPAPVGTP